MKANKKNVVVTAANDKYINYAINMLESINSKSFMIGVFDLGLSAANKCRISRACNDGCIIIDPGWQISPPDCESTPDYKKVFLAKPFIPDLFPGFSKYLWIDSDIWFQDSSALDDYFDAATQTGMAICYESHPMYSRSKNSLLYNFRRNLRLTKESHKKKRIRKYFGREMAKNWGNTPIMNSGIFCILADSPIWQLWRDMMKEANLMGHERKRLICDQTCLDLAVLINDFTPTIMPATHNWCVGLAEPLVHPSTGRLVDPIHPYREIKVLHSAGSIKRDFRLWQAKAESAKDPLRQKKSMHRLPA